jgi:hypothetical protein
MYLLTRIFPSTSFKTLQLLVNASSLFTFLYFFLLTLSFSPGLVAILNIKDGESKIRCILRLVVPADS